MRSGVLRIILTFIKNYFKTLKNKLLCINYLIMINHKYKI